MHYKSVYQITH